MKNKETLEEVAENYVKDSSHHLYQLRKQCFLDGAKWKEKRSYSDEEVLKILNEFCDNFYENSIREDIIIKWFQQFKKK